MKREKPALTRATTLAAFLKARTDLRIGVDAVGSLLDELGKLGELIVNEADKHARAEQRNTLMARDIQASLEKLLGLAGEATLFQQIEKLPAKETAQLAQKIEEWLKEH